MCSPLWPARRQAPGPFHDGFTAQTRQRGEDANTRSLSPLAAALAHSIRFPSLWPLRVHSVLSPFTQRWQRGGGVVCPNDVTLRTTVTSQHVVPRARVGAGHHDVGDEVDDGRRRLVGVVLGEQMALVVAARWTLLSDETEHTPGKVETGTSETGTGYGAD